jgi:hypothetical protein
MPNENTIHHSQKLYAAFLYGQNIPGSRYLTREKVRKSLRTLEPRIAFVDIVSRPDSMLLLCDQSASEQSVREALDLHLGCNSVVIEIESLSRIVNAALASLRSVQQAVEPPYRLKLDGVEWEWCLVLCSERLPCSFTEGQLLFKPTTKAVPLCILESRALLARKLRTSESGARIMLGAILIDPWKPVLARNGVILDCLTSRTLGQTNKVLRTAGRAHPA